MVYLSFACSLGLMSCRRLEETLDATVEPARVIDGLFYSSYDTSYGRCFYSLAFTIMAITTNRAHLYIL